MNPDRSQQVQRIVRDASELEPAERERFVEAECGHDAELRSDVESLLADSREGTSRVADDFGTFATVRAGVRRHPVAVAAAVLVIVALVSGGIGVSRRQAHIARVERAKTAARFTHGSELARAALSHPGDAIAAPPGSTAVRQRLVQNALEYLDNLSKEATRDPVLLRQLADAYEKIAAVQSGSAPARSGTVFSRTIPGDTAAAIASHEKAITLREEIVIVSQNDPGDAEALANAYTTVADFYLFNGSPQQAVDYLEKALPIAESLLASNPPSESGRHLSGRVYRGLADAYGSAAGPKLADARSALAYMRGALKLQERLAADFPNNIAHRQALAQTYSALGLIYSTMGEHEEQLEQNRKALAVARTLVESQPENASSRRELAVQLGNIGSVLVQLNDRAAALGELREAVRIYDELIAADAKDLGVRSEWAVAQRDLGVAVGANNPAEALQHFDRAIASLGEIAADDPKNTARRPWALAHLAKSRFHLEIHDPTAAVASALEGIRVGEEHAASSPDDPGSQNTLALLFTQLGAAYAKWAETDEASREHWQRAKEAYAKALALYERLKANGKLSRAAAGNPDKVARKIANCDAALAAKTAAQP